ncbi:MAG TPA: ADP-heptose--LPS heptosyltransferase, partial [Elusimicrobia bacterium]|nr:ADP-heptose--LPS heptosyltransferase [Elusimicrobiota bacterium]
MRENPRILLVRTDRIGDVTLTTPAAAALKAALPGARLHFLA